MPSKPFYQSRLFWVNAGATAAELINIWVPFIPIEWQAPLLATIATVNVLLRFDTTTAITLN